MSLRKKLEQAAIFAAADAVQQERGRVLWLLDELVRSAKAGLKTKLLIESDLHAARVKLQLAEAITKQLRRWVVSGHAPGPSVENETTEQKAERIAKSIEESAND